MAARENPLDTLVDFCADQLVALVGQVPDDAPPFGSRKLTLEEQIERYAEVRDDPQAWIKLLDGRGLREVVAYALRMEPLYQEGLRKQREPQRQLTTTPLSDDHTRQEWG